MQSVFTRLGKKIIFREVGKQYTGAPYPNMIDNTLEDEIEKLINQTKQGQNLSGGVIEGYVKRINGNS